MATAEILASLAKIFMMMIPGYIFSKKNIISKEQSNGITTVVLYLTWPCLVIDACQIPFSKTLLFNAGCVAAMMLTAMVVGIVLSLLLARVLGIRDNKKYVIMFMMLFANAGFMGIPIIKSLYSGEGVFYAGIYDAFNDVLIFTVGMFLICKASGKTASQSLKNIVTPGLIGVLIGLTLFICNLRLPGCIGQSVELVGSATSPLSMIILGYQLGELRFRDIFREKSVYFVAMVRQLILPCCVLGLAMLVFGAGGGDTALFVKVAVIETGMPIAASAVLMTKKYGGDLDFVSKNVLFTVVSSIVTISLITIMVEIWI